MEFLTIVILAMVAESVWETLKMIWQNGKVSVDKIGALVVALIITIGTNINIMPLLGLSIEWNWLGVMLTAILISRGATFVHELINKITTIKGEASIERISAFYNEEEKTI